jgi:hypothetical protein
MCERIKPWNPVGFRAKADFTSGPAAPHLKRLTGSGSRRQLRGSDYVDKYRLSSRNHFSL